MASYKELRAVNVADKIEKKNGLSYLSWPFAVDTLLTHDPAATWEFGTPIMFGETMMVCCTVTAFGKSMTSHLPVMDHRNKAIQNPDAFAVNTAMQRCLVKAIALHGLGLYIYAGEDLPEGADPKQQLADKFIAALKADEEGKTEEECEARKRARVMEVHNAAVADQELYKAAWFLIDSTSRAAIKKYIDIAKKEAA